MSIWQFSAAVEGFAKAQAGKKDQMSEAEKDEIWEMITAGDAVEVKAPLRTFDPSGALPIEAWG